MPFSVSYQIQAIDRFSATALRVEKAVDKLEKRTTKFSNRASKGFRKVAAGFAGIFTVGAAAFAGNKVLQIGSRFQDQLADLSAITGATGKDLDLLKNKSFEMGKEFSDSGSNVLEAFKLVGSAKAELLGNLPALIATTKEVLKLKNAAGIDLSSAAMFTAESLNIFGAGADQAARFVNVLAAGAKEGASEVMDTGEAMKVAGPLASKLGLSFEKVNALLQGIAQGGIKGRMAGTGLQGVLARLSKEGVDFSKVGLTDLFLKLGAAIDNTKDAGAKATLVQRLFGLEHQKTGLTLISQAKTLDTLTRKLTGTNVAQDQANIRLATFSSRMRSVGAAIDQKIVPVFDRLAPTIERVGADFAKWLESLSKADVSAFAKDMSLIAEAVVAIAKAGVFGAKLFIETGKFLGETAGEIATGDFTKTQEQLKTGVLDVNITLDGGTAEVSSVSSKSTGNTRLNVGRNMSIVAP